MTKMTLSRAGFEPALLGSKDRPSELPIIFIVTFIYPVHQWAHLATSEGVLLLLSTPSPYHPSFSYLFPIPSLLACFKSYQSRGIELPYNIRWDSINRNDHFEISSIEPPRMRRGFDWADDRPLISYLAPFTLSESATKELMNRLRLRLSPWPASTANPLSHFQIWIWNPSTFHTCRVSTWTLFISGWANY